MTILIINGYFNFTTKKAQESVLRREEEYTVHVCGQESGGDGGAWEKKERKTKAEVVG